MPDKVCAYCGSAGVLTREHLWPASLHKRLLEANESAGSLFWLRRTKSEIQGEPKIRDVCQACNNGYLSQLDYYICTLFDLYLVTIRRRHESVEFEYDYHLLKRWLWKMCFNSARMHNSIDLLPIRHFFRIFGEIRCMLGERCNCFSNYRIQVRSHASGLPTLHYMRLRQYGSRRTIELASCGSRSLE